MEISRQVLVWGETHLLHRLAAALRCSPLLVVAECAQLDASAGPGPFEPDVILVDGDQVTPEQFQELLSCAASPRPILISIDPLTYQLTVLSRPRGAQSLAQVAQVIEILSVTLPLTS